MKVDGLPALIEAIDNLARSIPTEALPTWVRWVELIVQSLLAILTLLAVYFAARSARSASVSARAAQEAADYVYLRDLKGQFDDNGYLMRFWRLMPEIDEYHRRHGFWSRDIVALRSESKHSALWNDALGGQQDVRYDMLTFYDLVLRLNAWLTRTPAQLVAAADVRLVNEYFGPWLVGTILKHRFIACTLRKSNRDQEYYLEYYGLRDEAYAALVRQLMDDLLQRNRLSQAYRPVFIRWDEAVTEYLESLKLPA